MDIFFKKITNKIKNVVCFRKINPHKHWGFVLRLFFIMIFISIMFSLYFLYQIKNDQTTGDDTKTKESPNLINEKLLKNVNELFEIKVVKEREARGIKE